MVVDDEQDIRNLAKKNLELSGFSVITASNGDEAIEKVVSESPDLILMDVVMTGKSGLEACKILKSQDKTRFIPIIIFTVLARDVDKKLVFDSGADDLIVKPFTRESLTSKIEKCLKESRINVFSKQLKMESDDLKGKKILFEYDPSTAYPRCVRQFALERASKGEKVLTMTKNGSVIKDSFVNDKDIQIIDAPSQPLLSTITRDFKNQDLTLIYDSLTDLALSTDNSTAYQFSREAVKLLSDTNITALFLINPSAHESKEINSLRGIFGNQIIYGKDGVKARIT
ncbi:hypothetical protein A3K80_03780 [Candidatus Bathyarchaeota archaeon RBG_13_38_9]|nr:MAG: hypothetical protein A3K80_03780 [Candidatus Bathyarchaeota archaeon RBG_13_38_9]